MTPFRMAIRLALLTLPLLLGACSMFDWATQNMPVIGQRCENWQCFTSSGQQQSKLNEEQRQHPAQNPAPAGQAEVNPMTADAPQQAQPVSAAAAAPAEPLAPPMPMEGAYRYVPRAPAAPGTTPFDGAMPAPVAP